MNTTHQVGSGRPLFELPNFRVWAMNGAPRLELNPGQKETLSSPKQPKEAA